MFALGVSFLYGVAIAAGRGRLHGARALTLLPALLGFFGVRVLGRKPAAQAAEGQLTTSDGSRPVGRAGRGPAGAPRADRDAAALVMA
jgi:RND superfamily putative drug exporter